METNTHDAAASYKYTRQSKVIEIRCCEQDARRSVSCCRGGVFLFPASASQHTVSLRRFRKADRSARQDNLSNWKVIVHVIGCTVCIRPRQNAIQAFCNGQPSRQASGHQDSANFLKL
jgi:hypothetical protein